MAEEYRQFIRHPSSIPIQFSLGRRRYRHQVRDVSHGGLCFSSRHAVETGKTILLKISTCQPNFEAQGVVRWCRPEGDVYLIGVEFSDESVRYAVRMVEQICHIEAYRRQISAETGEQLNSQQAALRWINKYAGSFPQPD